MKSTEASAVAVLLKASVTVQRNTFVTASSSPMTRLNVVDALVDALIVPPEPVTSAHEYVKGAKPPAGMAVTVDDVTAPAPMRPAIWLDGLADAVRGNTKFATSLHTPPT